MQSISTVEADSKVILLLVNLYVQTAITRLSVSSLANVSIRKTNVGKGVFSLRSQWLAIARRSKPPGNLHRNNKTITEFTTLGHLHPCLYLLTRIIHWSSTVWPSARQLQKAGILPLFYCYQQTVQVNSFVIEIKVPLFLVFLNSVWALLYSRYTKT